MNREELNEFLGATVEITMYDNKVYTGFFVLSSAYGDFGDTMYVLIDELTKLPICGFKNYHVTKCTLVPELETDSKSEK